MKIPSGLEELDEKQYVELLRIAMRLNNGLFTYEDARVALLSCLVGTKLDFRLYKKPIVKELYDQIDAVNGFFNEPTDKSGEKTFSVNLVTGKNMLKKYEGWSGVGDMMNGLKYGDFVEALDIIRQLGESTESREKDDLMKSICMILYHNVDNKVPPFILTVHAMVLFSSVWTMILEEPIEIGGQEIDFRILFKDGSGNTFDDHTGWEGVGFEVAQSGVFGHMAQVDDTPFWDVLLYLYKCKFEFIHRKNKQS